MGAAMRCVTSEPVAELIMMGIRPAIVDTAVITIGLTRRAVADATISLMDTTESLPSVSLRNFFYLCVDESQNKYADFGRHARKGDEANRDRYGDIVVIQEDQPYTANKPKGN